MQNIYIKVVHFAKQSKKKSVRKVATGFSLLISICCDMCFD